ncbi:hypothetical protein CDAR_90001 [Caerostris darwini]|uniref:Secreted protein n=1 Tax=Caerostris darwini TaxID=1538125 RepID=A0AAV4RDY6_9ARAC|nr:hypothetical protein CDAR_90001 [Caerostris darwini]
MLFTFIISSRSLSLSGVSYRAIPKVSKWKCQNMQHCNGAEVFRATEQCEAFRGNRFKIRVISTTPDASFRQDTNIFPPPALDSLQFTPH